ncbi:MAG: glycosyl hydrolase, partial [Clostridia bacterium]|nr:glycosyl hydrolase [Clostridia bacterium]
YVDYVALMAYDENGTWSTEAGSVASLPWVEESIEITLEEVPAEKLLLGIPFYARLWREQNGKVVKTSAIGMETAMKQIENAGAQIVYDEKTGQNYAEWKDGEQTVKIWLEDETSVLARIELCKKYDLAGIASWSRTFENPSILTFIKENLN